jgi:inosine-uridine nucleoside N-ribohydrolase
MTLSLVPKFVPAGEPVSLIFDTDIGNDIDDALALALIHGLENRGECRLLAVTCSKQNKFAASYIDAVNTYYGRGDIPIGRVRNGKTPEPGSYVKRVVETKNTDGTPRYPHDLGPETKTFEAIDLLRKTLASQPDQSVVLVVVGFSTNASRLLASPPDKHSDLPGRELVKKKVRLLSMMACSFATDPKKRPRTGIEYNVRIDIPEARSVIHNWPTPIVMSPWWLGQSIRYPSISIEHDFARFGPNPVEQGYRLWGKMPYDRPTYDLTSVLYAVRPDRAYFELSKPGRITIHNDGRSTFAVSANGSHRILSATPDQVVRVRELFTLLCSAQPRH